MNKLYCLLALLAAAPLASCDDEGTEIVNMQYQDQPVTVSDVTPVQGYAGQEFTITGTELGASKEMLKVYIGDFQAEVLSCTNTKLVATVPDEAVTGKILLEVVDTKMDSGFSFTVLGKPAVTAGSLSGYLGGEIVFTGTGLPAQADELEVTLGGQKAEIASYNVDEAGNGSWTVVVPKRLSEGRFDLFVRLFGKEIFKSKFEILASPVVNEISGILVREGSVLTFTGTGMAAFSGKVTVDFGGIVVSPERVTDTSLSVKVPQGYAGGMVSILFEGFPAMEAGEVQFITPGDITSQALVNSVQPFAADGNKPQGWSLNGAFTGDAISFPSAEPDGVLFMQSGWNNAEKRNAKLYQSVMLPRGKYCFSLAVAECGQGGSKGEFAVDFVVAKGNAAIPDLVKQNNVWEISDPSQVVLAAERVSATNVAAGSGHVDYTVEAVLDEDMEVTVGFVMQLTGQSYVKVAAVKVTLVE